MRFSLAAIVGTLLALTLILSACGDERTAVADKPTTVTRTAANAGTTRDTAAGQRTATPRRACRARLHGFLAAMDVLRDELARGLSYDQYLHEVQSLRAAYGKVEAGKLPLGCLVVSATPAERAFNLYIDAVNTWGDCLATVSCDTVAIEPRLQRNWALASAQLSTAQQGLRR